MLSRPTSNKTSTQRRRLPKNVSADAELSMENALDKIKTTIRSINSSVLSDEEKLKNMRNELQLLKTKQLLSKVEQVKQKSIP